MTRALFHGLPQSDSRLLHPEKVRGKLILTLRTDNVEAEIGIYDDNQKIAYEKWTAHRQLAETLHKKLNETLNESSKSLKDIQGVVFYKGPGSFTGLRIGLSVGNALAYSLNIPIVSTTGSDWIQSGIKKLADGKDEKIAMPEYGAPVHITGPRK